MPLLDGELTGTGDLSFMQQVFPAMSGALIVHAPAIMEGGGVMPADDPFWDGMNNFLANQTTIYKALSSAKESGGMYDCTICHGDIRSENIFFPKSGTGTQCFIDYQAMRRAPAEYDGVYMSIMSTDIEWRRANDLQLLNVFYDVLMENSSADRAEHT